MPYCRIAAVNLWSQGATSYRATACGDSTHTISGMGRPTDDFSVCGNVLYFDFLTMRHGFSCAALVAGLMGHGEGRCDLQRV